MEPFVPRELMNNSMNSNEGGFGCVEGGDSQKEEDELTKLAKKARLVRNEMKKKRIREERESMKLEEAMMAREDAAAMTRENKKKQVVRVRKPLEDMSVEKGIAVRGARGVYCSRTRCCTAGD